MMSLENRYVYAVISKLPEKQREEIEKEVLVLIDDMKEKYSDIENEEVRTKKVLEELGDPEKLAEAYRGEKRYLIGPNLFNRYIFVLKIVLLSIFIGVSVASLVEGVFVSNDGVVEMITNYFTNVVSSLFQGFTWVTIIFAILQYRGVSIDEKDEVWSIEKLPKVPTKKARTKKAESIVGIIFISIFTLLLYFFPNVFGVFIIENDKETIIPFLDIAYWEHVKYLLIVMFLVGISREIIKMIYGRWNIKLAIYYTVLTVISLGLFLILFTNVHIWNTDFITQLQDYYDVNVDVDFSMKEAGSVFVKIFILINVIDIIQAVVKGIKYND